MTDYQQELEDRGIDTFPSGDGYIMMGCPLPDHDDSHPSFSVNLADGSYRCFGCESRGSFIELIAEIDNVGAEEAAFMLKSSSNLDAVLGAIDKMLGDSSDHIEYLDVKSFHNVFPCVERRSKAWDYLVKTRSLGGKAIRSFDCRWGDHGKYQDRVIIPIFTPEGKLLSYVGKTIYKGVKPKTRKARSAARTLFGMYEMARSVNIYRYLRYIILVEGEFDAMYLQQFGIPAVAAMGTAVINKYQLRILRKTRATVVLSYDPDEAGEKAVYGDGKHRIGELQALKKYMKTVVVRLPEGKDPNELSSREVGKYYGKYRAFQGMRCW